MNEVLDEVRLSDFLTLRAPGMTGEVAVYGGTGLPERGVRAAQSAPVHAGVLRAIASSDPIRHQTAVVEIDLGSIPRGSADGRGSAPGLGWDIVLPPDELAVILEEDGGVLRWHTCMAPPTVSGARATAVVRLDLPIRSDPPVLRAGKPDEAPRAGILRRVVTFVAYKVLGKVGGSAAAWGVQQWERKHRPHRLLAVSGATFRAPATDQAPSGLETLRKGHSLLFIHGTASSTFGAFGDLDDPTIDTLIKRYAGRVGAFDHPTLATGPTENVQWLLNALGSRDGISAQWDIICHSRGGLVARELVRQIADDASLRERIHIGRCCFAGVPNGGTPLANPKQLGTFLNHLTNLAGWCIPDGFVVGELIEGILTVLRALAQFAVPHLDGLTSMTPDGSFLAQVRGADLTKVTLSSVASNYEVGAGGGLSRQVFGRAADGVFDAFFAEKNDLIVPFDGVANPAASSSGFPIAIKLDLDGVPVPHTNYFKDASVREFVLAQFPTSGSETSPTPT